MSFNIILAGGVEWDVNVKTVFGRKLYAVHFKRRIDVPMHCDDAYNYSTDQTHLTPKSAFQQQKNASDKGQLLGSILRIEM